MGLAAVPSLLLAAIVIAAVPAGCVGDQSGGTSYRGTVTILNRTTAPVTVASAEGGPIEVTVPACDEVTRAGFPVNWWTATSPGRDTFHSGGGFSVPQSFIVVTDVVTQQKTRPNPVPPCQGLLQPAQQ